MNCCSRQLYARMQEEIEAATAASGNEMLCVEKCFSIALLYWNRVKSIAESHLFPSEAEEIFFFKHIKPAFIAAMEYYMLLYQALLFKPAAGNDELLSYWLKQLKRVEMFFYRHQEFYRYCSSGQSDDDLIYFTRARNTATIRRRPLPGLQSSCDRSAYLAGRLHAFEQYRQYLEVQLATLTDGEQKKVLSCELIPA